MPSIRLIQSTGLKTDVTFAVLFAPVPGPDEDIALARAVMVALNTDRRARNDDKLPNPGETDRRGWWGDLDAKLIWSGWPIGSRLWLLTRAKITDSNAREGATIERARRYIAEALQPFVDNKIASGFTTTLSRLGTDRITGTIMIYRGNRSAVALEFEDLWSVYGG